MGIAKFDKAGAFCMFGKAWTQKNRPQVASISFIITHGVQAWFLDGLMFFYYIWIKNER